MSDPYGAAIFGLGERLNRLSRRMVPGGLGGRTDLASPRVALSGMVPPVTPAAAAAGGFALGDYLTVVVMPEDGVNLITGGYAEFDIQFTEVVASSGDALSWPGVGFDDHTVFVHEQGLYMFSGGFYAAGTNGAKGPVQARITDQGGNPALGLAIGGSYFGGSDTYVGTSWGLFELFDYSEMRLRVEHDVRTPSVPGPSVGDELTDAGNARSWYTYMTIAKVVPAVTGGGGGGPITARLEALIEDVPGGSTLTVLPWTVGEDNIGLTPNGITGSLELPSPGTVVATAWASWTANATGCRHLRLNGYWTASIDERQSVTATGRNTAQTTTIVEHFDADQLADALTVMFSHYGTSGTLDVVVNVSLAFWPD